MRERLGAIANFDWRPNEDLRVYVNTIYNEFTDEEGRDQLDYSMDRGDVTFPSPNEITYERGRASREFRQNNQTQKLYNVSPGVDWRFDRYELNLNYTYAHAEEHTPLRDDIEFRSGSRYVSTVQLGDALPTFSNMDLDLFDADTFPLRRIRLRRETIDEDLHAVKGDLTIDFTNTTDSFFKVGAKFTDRSKERDNFQEQWEPAGEAITFADTSGVLGNISGFYDGRYNFGPAMDYAGIMNFFYNQNPDFLELDVDKTGFNDRASDYEISEQIAAAYGMVSMDLGALNVIGGLRVEQTSGDYDAFAIRDTDGNGDVEVSDIAPLSFEQDYTHVLPSLALNYRPTEELVLRAAWTNTIGRPNYVDIVPTFEEEDGDGEAGNPDLDPYESMGLDVSAEYYPDADTVLAVAAFYKSIDNPIFTRTIENTSFAGVDLLSLSQPQNASSGELFGIEANAIIPLNILSDTLDGFGVSTNITYVDSNVDVPGRESDDLPFFRQSKWLAGGALFYEQGPLEARFAVNYRDDYLTGVGSNSDGDSYSKARTVLDARLAYRILDGVELFGSVSNLDKEPLSRYQGHSSRLTGQEEYGMNFDFGISAKF